MLARTVALFRWAILGVVAIVAAAAPQCANEAAQLFPVNVELVDGSGGTVNASAMRKICYDYPIASANLGDAFYQKAWKGFTDVSTVQFVLPTGLLEGTGHVEKIRVVADGPFALYYHDAFHTSEITVNAFSVIELEYPPQRTERGDPAHMTLFKTDASGAVVADKAMALWVSERSNAEATNCANYDNCCVIPSDMREGFKSATCDIGKPEWNCFSAGGGEWKKGQPVHYINYMAGLAHSPMANGGKSLLVHLGDDADLSVPLSNTFAEHQVADSAGCRALCTTIQNSNVTDLWKNADALRCMLSAEPAFKAKPGYGPITVNGFGRINGARMQQSFFFQSSRSVWDTNPGGANLNGYGGAYPLNGKSLSAAEAHTRWRVMSGLLELSSSAVKADGFAVDVTGVAVGWGAKRGDGAIRLQFERVPLGGKHSPADTNKPVRLRDVKTPGTWAGASDGPRVTADSSSLEFLYLHHSDDNLKIDSTNSTYRNIVLLQGNIGSAIELGTYGIGIRGNSVQNTVADGIFTHRITQQTSQEDNIGSFLGSRTW
jgi:hypothetical protein